MATPVQPRDRSPIDRLQEDDLTNSSMTGAEAIASESPPPPGWAQYLAFEQSVLQAAVSLADSKASFLLASSMGLMIYLLNTLHSAAIAPAARPIMWLAALLMALCASTAFTIIFPRIRDTKDDNIIYWGSPTFRGDRSAYADHCLSLSRTPAVLLRQQTDQLHRIAGILRAKYTALKFGLSTLVVGLVFFVSGQILR
jgi:hypothetical protein